MERPSLLMQDIADCMCTINLIFDCLDHPVTCFNHRSKILMERPSLLMQDIATLEANAKQVRQASLCGLERATQCPAAPCLAVNYQITMLFLHVHKTGSLAAVGSKRH